MYIVITESNAWEREKWHYAIDVSKQDAETLNHLVIFINCANKYYEMAKAESESKLLALPYHPSFNRHRTNPFAASKYSFRFYDEIDVTGVYPIGKFKSGTIMDFNDSANYNSDSFDLDMIISPKKMYSAMIAMRDKKENTLYKNFESVFLTKRKKAVMK